MTCSELTARVSTTYRRCRPWGSAVAIWVGSATMTESSDALPSLLPIGLADQGGAYNQVFRDAFQQIVLEGQDPAGVLAALTPNLQEIFTATEAACWPPDPPSDGPCQVQ